MSVTAGIKLEELSCLRIGRIVPVHIRGGWAAAYYRLGSVFLVVIHFIPLTTNIDNVVPLDLSRYR
jgi:hypothetical protein